MTKKKDNDHNDDDEDAARHERQERQAREDYEKAEHEKARGSTLVETTPIPMPAPPLRPGTQNLTTSPTVSDVDGTPAHSSFEATPLFQDQLAEIPSSDVAGTTMNAEEAKELVDAGQGDTLAEHPEPVAPLGGSSTLTGLSPSSAVIGDPDLTLTVTGTGFDAGSVIVFNNGDEPTAFVSDTEVSTTVKPSTATIAGDFPVAVRTGATTTAPLMFSFTDAAARGRKLFQKDK